MNRKAFPCPASPSSPAARRIRHPHLSLRLLAMAVLSFSAFEAPAAPPGYEARRWSLVFEDNFDGTALDEAKWSYHYPWGRTHNHEAYSRSGNVSVQGGKLILKALKESYGGMPYTTGVVNTSGKFHVTYGYLEARIKMPSSLGSWPAFWTLQSGWPPEIDIMEFPLSDTSQAHNEKYRYWWNYHWGTVSDHRSAGSEEWVSSDLTQGFHDYAVEWAPDSMRFFLDGELRGEVTDRSAIAQSAEHYMILNYAVGGWPGSPPSWPPQGDTYEIEWVRVWQLAEPAELIDLGNIVGGGDGRPAGAASFSGLNPDTGAFSNDLDLGTVAPTGANPQPVAAAFIDSVFMMLSDRTAVNTKGTSFSFPAGDSSGTTWGLIVNAAEPGGSAPGLLRLGPKGAFTRGIGLHASSGITFDLDELRARHGARRVAFFSALAGEGSLQAGGSVNNHVLLADAEGRLLHSRSTGAHRDDGRLLEVEIPREARFLTLATGSAGDGIGQDHGVFANAFLAPCSAGDPALCGPVGDQVLVFSGSTWSYLDEGSPPPQGWTGPAFPAVGWKTGRAQLGYGDGDESTEIGFGGDPSRRRVTTHFRRLFAVQDPDGVSKLSLWLLRDDGAIVYLNGTEVLRSNLPDGPVGAETLAIDAVADAAEEAWDSAILDPCLLVEGTNVLAVEVHQASRTSSDLSFDLLLAVDRDPKAPRSCGRVFLRGDCNDSGVVDLSDAVCTLNWLFLGTEPPGCVAAANANGDAAVDISDPVALLSHLFLGGPAPVLPYPTCGRGTLPADEDLGCEAAPASCR